MLLYIYLLVAIGVYFRATQDKEEVIVFETLLSALFWPVLVGDFMYGVYSYHKEVEREYEK